MTPFPESYLFHYIVCEGKIPDNGGVPVRGKESKVREPKSQLRLIKWNSILM